MTTAPTPPPRKQRRNYSLSLSAIADLTALAAHTASKRGGKANVSAMIAELARAEMRRRHLEPAAEKEST